ncbi:hypothetical protein GWI33_020046 [Rhynchophorus ferrugineus]|uniref:PH domain-containing protein n=1 Tax=Rhynchophorus ferrugineus TaxID=354439 RepID=A0A834HQ10_RHYFE|nr:hypothetical protein GWI33_020046 [Rhynchophorus ferrugineus]
MEFANSTFRESSLDLLMNLIPPDCSAIDHLPEYNNAEKQPDTKSSRKNFLANLLKVVKRRPANSPIRGNCVRDVREINFTNNDKKEGYFAELYNRKSTNPCDEHASDVLSEYFTEDLLPSDYLTEDSDDETSETKKKAFENIIQSKESKTVSNHVHSAHSSTYFNIKGEDISHLVSMLSKTLKNQSNIEAVGSLYDNIYGIQNLGSLHIQVYIQKTIEKQLQDLVQYGKLQQGFIGNQAHIEAERLLLLTRRKIHVLENTEPSFTSSNTYLPATITLNNLKCFINSEEVSDSFSKTCSTLYVLVLRSGNIVHATNVAATNSLRWVNFNGPFIFNNCTENFKIIGELYSLQLSSNKTFKSLFNNNNIHKMKLIGETFINLKNAFRGSFYFRHVDGYKYKPDQLVTSVDAKVKWPVEYRGFLTVANAKPNCNLQWKKKWCVLRKNEIFCYNFPYEENYEHIGTTLTLNYTSNCEEVNYIRPKKKTLLLKSMQAQSKKTLYLAPDPEDTLTEWKEKINLIIDSLTLWNKI